MVVKSFIRAIGKTPGWPPSIFADLTAWAILWEGVNINADGDRTTDARDSSYRLYSERKFMVECGCGKMKVTAGSIETDHGSEGPLNTPELITWDVKAYQKTDFTYSFEWSAKGRPNALAELGFQQVYPRTSRYIWHTIFGEIGCPNGKGKAYVSLFGSKFPTHRVWVDGEDKDHKDQSNLRDLWTPHPQDSTRVW